MLKKAKHRFSRFSSTRRRFGKTVTWLKGNCFVCCLDLWHHRFAFFNEVGQTVTANQEPYPQSCNLWTIWECFVLQEMRVWSNTGCSKTVRNVPRLMSQTPAKLFWRKFFFRGINLAFYTHSSRFSLPPPPPIFLNAQSTCVQRSSTIHFASVEREHRLCYCSSL
jgi:hypothetical protein